MKKLVILFLFVSLSSGLFSQAGIKIYTKLDEAKFKITFNGEVENTIPIKEVSFDSLDYKKKQHIVISFTGDSIADIDQELLLSKDQVREFEIVKRTKIGKKTASVTRKIGNFLNIGNHSKEDELYDAFYLQEIVK